MRVTATKTCLCLVDCFHSNICFKASDLDKAKSYYAISDSYINDIYKAGDMATYTQLVNMNWSIKNVKTLHELASILNTYARLLHIGGYYEVKAV